MSLPSPKNITFFFPLKLDEFMNLHIPMFMIKIQACMHKNNVYADSSQAIAGSNNLTEHSEYQHPILMLETE